MVRVLPQSIVDCQLASVDCVSRSDLDLQRIEIRSSRGAVPQFLRVFYVASPVDSCLHNAGLLVLERMFSHACIAPPLCFYAL
jgi:hypothetical protein